MKRLFDTDPLTGAIEHFHFDESEDKFTIHTVNDVEPVIERNKKLFNHDDGGWNSTRDGKRIASIPMEIILKWKQDYGVDLFNRDHLPKVKQLLNDPDWRYLRTAPGCL